MPTCIRSLLSGVRASSTLDWPTCGLTQRDILNGLLYEQNPCNGEKKRRK